MSEISSPIDVRAGVEYKKETYTEVTDHKNFFPMTNKIETVGTIHKKIYAIICDGKGVMNFYRLGDKASRQHEIVVSMMELKSLLESGLISKEEYDTLRNQMIIQLKSIW